MAKVVFRDLQGHEIVRPPVGITQPTEASVEIELGDGVTRELRYPMRKLKLLKEHNVLGRRDDSDIPLLIWIGLHAEDGTPPDVSVAQIEALGVNWLPYLGAAFVAAFTHSMPTAPKEEEVEKKESSLATAR